MNWPKRSRAGASRSMMKHLVVGYVERVEQHPEADRLKICQVDTGGETNQIICGASNVEADSYVVVCKVGGRLPGGDQDQTCEAPRGGFGRHDLLDDQVMEFDLTPNRKDALSMAGAAYEVRALFGGEVIRNEDAAAVPYYGARVVENVKIAPAPAWMQLRLIKAGIRPINNVVDISNEPSAEECPAL